MRELDTGRPAVVLDRATKRFGKVTALSDLSLTIESGSIALLGRNGAGKSTMLNLVSGVMLPTEGAVLVGGHVPGTPEATGLIARQLEFPGTAGFLNPRKISRLLAMTSEEVGRLQENLRGFDVPDRPMSELSRGNQLKVALSVAFARQRPILLLDEPTSGLDIFGVDVLTGMIEDRTRRGLVTIGATHQPTLTPELFDRAIVIEGGSLLFDGSLPSLLDLAPDTPENAAPTARLASAYIELLKGNKQI